MDILLNELDLKKNIVERSNSDYFSDDDPVKVTINDNKIIYMTLNILFLALSAYVRPIYCFFSLYFFVFYIKNLNPKYLVFIYILLNI